MDPEAPPTETPTQSATPTETPTATPSPSQTATATPARTATGALSPTEESDPDSILEEVPGFGTTVAVVALVAAMLLARRRDE